MAFLAAIPAFFSSLSAMQIMGGVGMGLSALGSISQGMSQQKMAEYNAEVYRMKAEAARKAGDWEYNRRHYLGSSLLSKQWAMYGKSGVELTGSPLEVMAETAANVERDALAARYAYRVEAGQAESAARLQEFYGDQAFMSGLMKAGSTLLTAPMMMSYTKSPLSIKAY